MMLWNYQECSRKMKEVTHLLLPHSYTPSSLHLADRQRQGYSLTLLLKQLSPPDRKQLWS